MEFLGKIFESLEEDYKKFLIAIVIAFPVCYLDIWKLYPDFREYEFYPQLMLPLGAAVLFSGLGIFIYSLTLTIIDPTGKITKYFKFNSAVILIPLFFPSIGLCAGLINSFFLFKIYIIMTSLGMMSGAMIFRFSRPFKHRTPQTIEEHGEEYKSE